MTTKSYQTYRNARIALLFVVGGSDDEGKELISMPTPTTANVNWNRMVRAAVASNNACYYSANSAGGTHVCKGLYFAGLCENGTIY